MAPFFSRTLQPRNCKRLPTIFHDLGNRLFIRRCQGCEEPEAFPFCPICEDALLHAGKKNNTIFTENLGSLWLYGGPLSIAFSKSKFTKNPYQMKILLEWLLHRGLTESHITAIEENAIQHITWVPAHPLRRFQRGFNAAQLFAHALSKRLCVPLIPTLNCKRNDPPFSLGTSQKERQKQIRGRYQARPLPPLDAILLVDDITTSGATLDEAKRTLKSAGAKAFTFTLAQTPKHSSWSAD